MNKPSLISLLEGIDSFNSPFSVNPTPAAVRTICAYRALPVRSAKLCKDKIPGKILRGGPVRRSRFRTFDPGLDQLLDFSDVP